VRSLGFGQVLVEQVVAPAQPVEQVAGGEVNVRLVVGVAPHVVGDGGLHVPARGVEVLPVALDLVSECRLGYPDADIVLRAPRLRRRGRRLSLERAQIEEDSLPDVSVRRARALA
jgi:hypothetical protein